MTFPNGAAHWEGLHGGPDVEGHWGGRVRVFDVETARERFTILVSLNQQPRGLDLSVLMRARLAVCPDLGHRKVNVLRGDNVWSWWPGSNACEGYGYPQVAAAMVNDQTRRRRQHTPIREGDVEAPHAGHRVDKSGEATPGQFRTKNKIARASMA